MSGSIGRSVAYGLIAVASAIVVVAVAVVLFLNPLWVGFEQARTHADTLTGYSLDDVHRVTNGVLGDLVIGPPAFAQEVAGVPVFDPKERQHLVDVRGAFLGFFGLVVVSLVILVVAGWRMRDRVRLWKAVGTGAKVLAVLIVAVGTFAAVFFDVTFELFHRLLFAGGTYTFDPLHERLVQLFPEDFWSETSIVLAVVILLFCIGLAWLASRRARALTPAPAAGLGSAAVPSDGGVA